MHIPLRAIGVFHAVARTGSVTRAADELGVTPSAVSQQIQSLEVSLGTTLIGKSGRNVVLTEAGERYFEMIQADIESIAEATQRIRGFRSVTTLTVRTSPSLSTKWLLPRLASFIDAHPEIELRLDGTNEPTTFQRENVDLKSGTVQASGPVCLSKASSRNGSGRFARHRWRRPPVSTQRSYCAFA